MSTFKLNPNTKHTPSKSHPTDTTQSNSAFKHEIYNSESTLPDYYRLFCQHFYAPNNNRLSDDTLSLLHKQQSTELELIGINSQIPIAQFIADIYTQYILSHHWTVDTFMQKSAFLSSIPKTTKVWKLIHSHLTQYTKTFISKPKIHKHKRILFYTNVISTHIRSRNNENSNIVTQQTDIVFMPNNNGINDEYLNKLGIKYYKSPKNVLINDFICHTLHKLITKPYQRCIVLIIGNSNKIENDTIYVFKPVKYASIPSQISEHSELPWFYNTKNCIFAQNNLCVSFHKHTNGERVYLSMDSTNVFRVFKHNFLKILALFCDESMDTNIDIPFKDRQFSEFANTYFSDLKWDNSAQTAQTEHKSETNLKFGDLCPKLLIQSKTDPIIDSEELDEYSNILNHKNKCVLHKSVSLNRQTSLSIVSKPNKLSLVSVPNINRSHSYSETMISPKTRRLRPKYSKTPKYELKVRNNNNNNFTNYDSKSLMNYLQISQSLTQTTDEEQSFEIISETENDSINNVFRTKIIDLIQSNMSETKDLITVYATGDNNSNSNKKSQNSNANSNNNNNSESHSGDGNHSNDNGNNDSNHNGQNHSSGNGDDGDKNGKRNNSKISTDDYETENEGSETDRFFRLIKDKNCHDIDESLVKDLQTFQPSMICKLANEIGLLHSQLQKVQSLLGLNRTKTKKGKTKLAKTKKQNSKVSFLHYYTPLNPKRLYQIPREFTDNIIPNAICENICAQNMFDFVIKSLGINAQNYKPIRNEMVRIFDFGLHKSAKECLYFLFRKLDPFTNRNYKWFLHSILTQTQICDKYKLSKHVSLPTAVTIENVSEMKEIEHKIIENQKEIISKTNWHKLAVYNRSKGDKKYNKRRMTLSLTKEEFIKSLKENDMSAMELIQIVMFGENDRFWSEYVWVVSVHSNIHIGIAFKYKNNKKCKNKKVLEVCGIHLHKDLVMRQHFIVCPKHSCNCRHLRAFQSSINDIHIGNPDDDKNRLKTLQNQFEELQSKSAEWEEKLSTMDRIESYSQFQRSLSTDTSHICSNALPLLDTITEPTLSGITEYQQSISPSTSFICTSPTMTVGTFPMPINIGTTTLQTSVPMNDTDSEM